MASGVPVVASNLSGIPELVVDSETGILTPPRDARAIADALERLAVDPALARGLARGGRERVQAQYDARSNARMLASKFGRSVAVS
jgi:colanic acid/amylovoran biosynthesis glycosyltransferase